MRRKSTDVAIKPLGAGRWTKGSCRAGLQAVLRVPLAFVIAVGAGACFAGLIALHGGERSSARVQGSTVRGSQHVHDDGIGGSSDLRYSGYRAICFSLGGRHELTWSLIQIC